ncbi:MAG: FAD/NAD(P)-binding protein [Pseudomonadota bacterium]
MAQHRGRHIAVIGGGFSGSLLAFHLLRRCGPDDRVMLVERNPRFGLGLAYSTGNPNHLLNVRAGNMSAFSDRPSHFVDWLRELPPDVRASLDEPPGPASFVPRRLFGRYVQQLLGDQIWREGHGRHLFLVTDEAVALRRQPKGWLLELAVGRSFPVDLAVLAIGNFPPAASTPRYFGNPWDEHAVANLDPAQPVLILGTGLTMVDTVISLLDRGHHGHIYALSRRGLLPQVHASTNGGALPAPWVFDPPPSGHSVLALLRRVRATCRAAATQGRDWRLVIDGLRPHTQRLWQEMPLAERSRFLRHLRPWWDVHRHRAAPCIMDRVAEARARGQLELLVGRLGLIERDAAGLAVSIAPRAGLPPFPISVDRIIDCSGPRTDCTLINQPLLQQLLHNGHIRPDPLRLGLDVTAEGAAIDRNDEVLPDLFAIGPITRGAFWEIIAVPDIRVACERLAQRLLPRTGEQATPAGALVKTTCAPLSV